MHSSLGKHVAAALGTLFLVGTALAATEREVRFEPTVYALTGGRIVPVEGAVLERGTVLLRDGMIQAVGSDVEVPPDAIVVDCTGLNVYPGLIDARTGLLQPAPVASEQKPKEEAAPPAPSPGYANAITEVRPERRAADLLELKEADLEKWRAAGFTTALSVPRGKIFLGRSAVLNLAGDRIGQMLLDADTALHLDFQTSGDNRYPGSLMGVMAVLRQTFYDAGSYRNELARHDRLEGREMRRPELNASLEAVQPALDGKLPVIFDAPRRLEALRALNLAREFGFRPIVAGVRDAYRIVPQLRRAGATVLLSMDYPEPKASSADVEDADRDSLEDLRDRAKLPETAKLLAEAGIPFALTSFNLPGPGDLAKKVDLAIQRGLPRETAIAALTLYPARILGLDRMTGSLTVGKIGNVVVTEGELFDAKTKIRHLFIDGRKQELEEKPQGDPNAKIELAGTWETTVDSPQGAIAVTLKITGSEGSFSGEAQAMGLSLPIQSVSIEGNSVTIDIDGAGAGMPGTIQFSVVVEADSLSGNVDLPSGDSASVSGKRTAGPQGRNQG